MTRETSVNEVKQIWIRALGLLFVSRKHAQITAAVVREHHHDRWQKLV